MTRLVVNQKYTAVALARRSLGEGGACGEPSGAVLGTAEMFGIGLDESYAVTLYDNLELDVRPGDVVFATGPSGSGKSVLLGRLREAFCVAWPHATVADLATVALPGDRPVIDLFGGTLSRRLKILSTAGLADAFLLLRTAAELSDGQRYRLRLALAIEKLKRPASGAANGGLLIADEFCSTLDRLCARAIAYRVRRLADATGITVLAASAHDDLTEDLAPDVLITKHDGPHVEVRYCNAERGTRNAEQKTEGNDK
jgi:uncharacterized protein